MDGEGTGGAGGIEDAASVDVAATGSDQEFRMNTAGVVTGGTADFFADGEFEGGGEGFHGDKRGGAERRKESRRKQKGNLLCQLLELSQAFRDMIVLVISFSAQRFFAFSGFGFKALISCVWGRRRL